MCGIAGIISPKLDRKPLVSRMLAKLEHRGPDSEGTWSGGPYSGGMRRLSILDLEGGSQPLFDESGRIVLFYNGEIYNSPELRAELEREGVRFKTHSDGEVICHLYRKFGKKTFSLLDGMFAAALWDSEAETLFLARDYPGEKPLYFSKLDGGGVVFASEIPALLQCGNISRELDQQAIWDYTTFLWVPEPATIYKNIRAIMPGAGLEVSAQGIREFSFHQDIPTPANEIGNDEQIVESTHQIVEQAIKSRLLSDVPVGAFLSGGLDSSIVCTVARRELSQLHTFSVGFENVKDPYHGNADEAPLAEEYARRLGTIHSTIRVTGQDFRDALPRFLRAAGQPYAVSSGLGVMAIAKAAREKGIKVLLSGDGADEAFGGYSWYSSIPESFRRRPQENRNSALRFMDGGGSVAERTARLSDYDPQTRAWAWHYYASEEEKRNLFRADFQAESSLKHFAGEKFRNPEDYIRHDQKFYFPNEMLSKVDRMTMAYSVEGRAPFAAPSVQKFAARLPWDSLVRGEKLKWALREAFSRDLPTSIVTRQKHGFNVPIDHWLKNDWHDLFRETFADSSYLMREKILAPEAAAYAKKLLNDPNKVAGHVLFTFVMLNLWWSER